MNSPGKAYDVCMEMFIQRGYDVVEQDEERILAIKEDGAQICAFIPKIMSKFNVDCIQQYISMLKKMDIYHCVIVYKDSATPIAKKVVEDSHEILIELFNEEEMQYNITKHKLVPLHKLKYRKNSKECAAFSKYPVILKSDPVSRFYGFQKGDVIEITRPNGYITYRIVK
jgi:DNA-directed RNA polymerase I, II, and III subunit RPABC1